MSPVPGLEPALERWAAVVRRRALPILLGTAAVTGVLLVYAVRTLGIDTDTGGMASDDLPYRQAARAFDAAFPELGDALTILVEAEAPGLAEDAATALATRLRRDTSLFASVHEPAGGAFFERHALLYLEAEALERLAERLEGLAPLLRDLERDPTVAGLARALERGGQRGDAELAPVLGLAARAVHAASSGAYAPLPWGAVVLGLSPRGSDSRHTIIARPRLAYENALPGRAAVERVRTEVEALELVPRNGVRVRLTGAVAIEHEELLTAVAGLRGAGVLALVAVSLILWLALRSVRLIVACLTTLLAGLVATAAFAAAAVGRLNLISVAFAVLYIGLGIDYAIHLALRHRAVRSRGIRPEAALRRAVREVGASLVVSALTTAACFYAFIPTDFTGVSELGLIGGTGMLIGLLATLTVLPAFLHVWPGTEVEAPGSAEPGTAGAERESGLPRLGGAVRRHRPAILAVAAGLTGAALVLLPGARFDHDPLNLRDPDSESVRAFRSLLADSSAHPLTISVLGDDAEEAAAMAERLGRLEPVGGTRRLEDFVPEAQGVKLRAIRRIAAALGPPPDPSSRARGLRPPGTGPRPERAVGAASDAPRGGTVPDAVRSLEASLVALRWRGSPAEAEGARNLQHLLRRWRSYRDGWPAEARDRLNARLEAALVGTLPGRIRRLRSALEAGSVTLRDLPATLVDRWIGDEGERRIEVLPARPLTTPARVRTLVDAVRAIVPEVAGRPVEELETGRVAVRAFRAAIAWALAATVALLLALFRSPASVLLVVGPLLAAGAWTGAATVLLGLPFNFANVIALPLLLGVGVDNGIHMVHQSRLGASGARAPRDPLGSSTGRAVLYATLTTVASFGNLAVARHVGMASMGRLLTVGMTCVLAATLLLIPALLAGRKTTEPSRVGRPGAPD